MTSTLDAEYLTGVFGCAGARLSARLAEILARIVTRITTSDAATTVGEMSKFSSTLITFWLASSPCSRRGTSGRSDGWKRHNLADNNNNSSSVTNSPTPRIPPLCWAAGNRSNQMSEIVSSHRSLVSGEPSKQSDVAFEAHLQHVLYADGVDATS